MNSKRNGCLKRLPRISICPNIRYQVPRIRPSEMHRSSDIYSHSIAFDRSIHIERMDFVQNKTKQKTLDGFPSNIIIYSCCQSRYHIARYRCSRVRCACNVQLCMCQKSICITICSLRQFDWMPNSLWYFAFDGIINWMNGEFEVFLGSISRWFDSPNPATCVCVCNSILVFFFLVL